MMVDDGRKRIKLMCALDLSQRIIELPFGLEITSKPLMRRRVIWIEANGALEFFFSFRPTPHEVIDDS
jgi:hypothetical protein